MKTIDWFERLFVEDIFKDPKMASVIMAPMPDLDKFHITREKLLKNAATIDSEFRMFYQEPILTREQEYHLFRQYNYLKYQSKQATDFHQKTVGIKHQLVASNTRLVINLAKKQKDYKAYPNRELLSEIIADGYVGLVRSVDYFDYRMGNKFNTYATWAVMREMGLARQRRYEDYLSQLDVDADNIINEILDKHDDLAEYDTQESFGGMYECLNRLNKRQKSILSDYYLSHLTLREIGRKNRISKERVRQIKQTGLKKLKELINDSEKSTIRELSCS